MMWLGYPTHRCAWRSAAILAAITWLSPDLLAEEKPAAKSGDKRVAEKHAVIARYNRVILGESLGFR